MSENEEKLLKTIGRRIVERRKELNLTQEDLAYSANVDRTYVGYVENGRQNVSVAVLLRFAVALKMNIKDFFND